MLALRAVPEGLMLAPADIHVRRVIGRVFLGEVAQADVAVRLARSILSQESLET
jgi:hypothetical protein